MKSPFIRTVACTLAVASLAACAQHQSDGTPTPVRWAIATAGAPIASGDTTRIRVDAAIQDGWHVYSITQPAGGPIATRISVPAGQPFLAAGAVEATTPPHVAFDDAFRMNVQLHVKAASFDVPVRFTGATAAAGSSDSVHVNVRYQACNASLCLPPQTARLAAAVPVRAR
jgi:thiol:disulfide interchange protein DsbD